MQSYVKTASQLLLSFMMNETITLTHFTIVWFGFFKILRVGRCHLACFQVIMHFRIGKALGLILLVNYQLSESCCSL